MSASPPPSPGAGGPPAARAPWGLLGLLALLLAAPAAALFTVDATEAVVVTSFGEPVRSITAPGLNLRAPWPLHQIVRFDRRARVLPVAPAETLTRDKKNLVVEPFVVWRIHDPQRFLETVGAPGSAGTQAAETQIADLVVSRIAASLGQRDFGELMRVAEGDGLESAELLPPALLSDLRELTKKRLGVDVLELRLRHVGLPLQNEQSIYERMRAERSRIANQYRSEGEERAASIRAEADRRAAELLAQADKDAADIRAAAEQEAAALYAAAFARDPQLYLTLRELEAAEAILDDDTVLVVPTETVLTGLVGPGRP